MRFPSTLLPQNNEPEEIQKGNLDLLDKINQIAPIYNTAANLAKQNPRVLPGQMAFETDTGYFKIGTDGKTQYNALPYQWKVPYFKAQPAGSYAPMPTTSAGAGQWPAAELPGAGNPWTLNAGGTWAYWGFQITNTFVVYTAVKGVAAGGTTVGSAVGGYYWIGFSWRQA